MACGLGRHLVEHEVPADDVPDGRQLLTLCQRVRPGQHVVVILVAFVAERANRDGCDVALVNGRGLRGAMKPAHDLAVSNLRCPPIAEVQRERTGSQYGPWRPGLLDQIFDALVHVPERIGLLKKGMVRSNRRGKQDDALDARRDVLDRTRSRPERRHPHEKYRVDIVQRAIECFG